MQVHVKRPGRILWCLVVLGTACATSKSVHFGQPMKMSRSDTIDAANVFANKTAYDGTYVRVRGKVDSVCKSMGCWLRLTDDAGKETLFVKFTCPVEGRLIPLEAVGRTAIVEGTLEVGEISEAEARHYREDAGASPEEIAAIVGPQKIVRMQSPAARVYGL